MGFTFDPHASEEERRKVVEEWYKFNQDYITQMIEDNADQSELHNIPAIEKDYYEYANYHVFGECLPDVDTMMFGHSNREDVHELPDIERAFIQQVIDECFTYERWESMYLEHELSNVLPLLSDQYSENEIQEALSKKYEENPGWAIHTAGSNYSAVAQELIQDYLNYPSVHAALSEEQKAYIEDYVQSVVNDFLSDLGVQAETYSKVCGITAEQWIDVITRNLQGDIEDTFDSDSVSIVQIMNTSVIQKELDEQFQGMQNDFETKLPDAVLNKLDAELQEPETYLYVRQHVSEMIQHFDNMVCYLQDEIDLDTFLVNVFPEMEK